jgi:hypothetical protein
MITLNEQQVAELNNFIQDQLPTKYGVVLLQWFGKIQEEQNSKTEAKDPYNNPNDPNAGLG